MNSKEKILLFLLSCLSWLVYEGFKLMYTVNKIWQYADPSARAALLEMSFWYGVIIGICLALWGLFAVHLIKKSSKRVK